MSNFSSEGFDLDALAVSEQADVVYEIGGGATVTETEVEEKPKEEKKVDELSRCEGFKQQGNEEFKKKNYLEAYDLYTEAIDACPCPMKGDEILKLRDEFNVGEREKAYSRQRLQDEERRKKSNSDKEEKKTTEPPKAEALKAFHLPSQANGEKLAIYYCNRAATLTSMERYDEAIKDCDVASLLNEKYTKAFVRRSAAHEKADRSEEALRDAKQALALEPRSTAIKKSVDRLQKIESERLEKLKEETMGKFIL
jgi:tetratricopeptide (TPR) repeat protein